MMHPTRVTSQGGPPLLDVQDLTVEFRGSWHRPSLRAVDAVSLSIARMETVGLVGESGSGKSTIGRAVLGLVAIKSGRVIFDDADITCAGHRERQALSAKLQVVFQDPYSSLNPTRTIGQTLGETIRAQRKLNRREIDQRVRATLERVGISGEACERFPAHFSGGQRQRIAIARALIVQPQLVVCDEPLSALDLSLQAQVLNLLRELQNEFKLSYLFIAHDLAVVRHLSHRIVVLYHGRIMESGDASAVYNGPAHPYTRALLEAAPVPDPEAQARRRSARLASRTDLTAAVGVDACPFATRCPYAIDMCHRVRPKLELTPEGAHVACHRWRDLRKPALHLVVRQEATTNASGLHVRGKACDG